MLYYKLMKYLTLKEGAGFIPEYVVPFYNGKLGIEKVLQDFEGDPLIDKALGRIRFWKKIKEVLNYKIL